MKNKPALSGFLISLLVAVGAFAVYGLFLSKKNDYLVDNPTPETFYFKINNGEQKIISSGQYLKIDLNQGRNTIAVYNSKKEKLYDSVFNVTKSRGLLNLAQKDYYVNTQYYGYQLNKDSLLMKLGATDIDGKAYLGAPKKVNKLYYEDFYFNIDEEYDAVVKNIQKVESRTKIFRKQDFINYYNEYYK